MLKTSKEIQGDVYKLLKNSTLSKAINGKVYKAGYRPRGSEKEDIVVVFTAGLSEQIQTGIVTVLIFVPDVPNRANGIMLENGERIEVLERKSLEWFEQLKSSDNGGYLFTLMSTIQTNEDIDQKQHFISIRLKYKFYDGD